MKFIRAAEISSAAGRSDEAMRPAGATAIGGRADSLFGQPMPVATGGRLPSPPGVAAGAAGADLSFLSDGQREAAHAIRNAIAERRPFVALTGAAGLGKTTLLAAAVVPLPGLPLRVLRVSDPDQVSAELAVRIEHVAFEQAGRTPEGERHTVLVVDDAHTASVELLRCLARIAKAGEVNPRSPQAILAGRPALWDRLAPSEFAPLVERIVVRPVLQPLSDGESQRLIRQLLDQPRRIAGQVLTEEAQREVVRLGQGRPERIGAILRGTLTLGDIETRPPISGDMIRSAASALDGPRQQRRGARSTGARILAIGLIAAALIAGGAVLGTQGWPPDRVLTAVRDLVKLAVSPATHPRGSHGPVLADATQRAPAVPQSEAALPRPTDDSSSTPAGTSSPVIPTPVEHDEDRPAAVADSAPPQPVPATPAPSEGHDQSLAVTGSLPGPTPPERTAAAPELTGLAPVPPPETRTIAPVAAPAPAVRPAPAGTSLTPLSPEMVAILLRRGDEMLALGDYSAARRFYERAASAGSALGARGMARTYDPAVVSQGSTAADPAAAVTWYGVAATLGDAEASARLQQLKAER